MEKKIRRFDFAKKPYRPSAFLFFLAKNILCKPDLKRRKATIRKHGMEPYEDVPYLLLINHASMVDLNLMMMSTHPRLVNNVMTLEGFRDYTEPLMRGLGVLGKRKYVSDIHLVRNISYCLKTLKTVFAMFPEARYSLDGCTSFLPESLGGLVKMMKVPVVMLKLHGNFVTNPQWNKINKYSWVEADMYPLLTVEEVKSLPSAELFNRIKEAFRYDDFAWQYENKIKIDHPERAKGLNCLLYKCPKCGVEHRTEAEGDTLRCTACGKSWYMDEYGRLSGSDGVTEFPHIPDWSNWERQCVREEIRNGTYYFEDTVRVETLPNAWVFHKQGEGKLVQTPEGTTLTCNLYGKPYKLEKPGMILESLHVEYDYKGHGDCVDISIPDESFWCYLSKKDAITKLSFATEEIHFLAKEKKTAAKRSADNKGETS
ncbi:MAG: hypothetical protein E7630_03055 [Ruminococcaceae bacterium]|nr:hypothetical protein [Oscillospiraceae bacterium]